MEGDASATGGGEAGPMTDRTFKWWLWTLDPNYMPSDEFMADGFRIRVGGGRMELFFEGSGAPSPADARAVADKYVSALQRYLATPLRLMTDEEFSARTTPPFGVTLMGRSATREDRERTYWAVNAARNEMLADSDPALRRVYDYLRKAQEKDGRFTNNAINEFYKAVETIENALGGEAKAGQILGCLQQIKALKRVANERTGDERHAPADPAATPPHVDIGGAYENTLPVVRAYEAHLTRRSRSSSAS
jgi:hypothetical protein